MRTDHVLPQNISKENIMSEKERSVPVPAMDTENIVVNEY